ncbi:kinase-like domain-containing protein [Rhizophagus clarus]|uniref:Kinase-like domain-containing protein n=1 Tax=Rhizophagus clarus TaxID=94130 RepID=A0A8H3KTS0_9GLOM|nr:kinase-like domain-containing protein [Rhizophagus clarus]
MTDKQIIPDSVCILNINNSLHEFSHIIQNFDKINVKEIEPTIIFNEDLGIVIDELINFIFKELNEEICDDNIINKKFINFMNNHEIIPREIYNYLLYDQNNSNSIYLLGYFNYYGIEVNINQQRAFELYQKAMKLKNDVAQLELAAMYIYGNDIVNKNYNEGFKLIKELADKGIPNAINKLGLCYESGQYNLASMYEIGNGTEKNMEQAIYWYKKSAEQGFQYAKSKLETLSQK